MQVKPGAEGTLVAEGFDPQAPALTDFTETHAEKAAEEPRRMSLGVGSRWSSASRLANAPAPSVQSPRVSPGNPAEAIGEAVPPAGPISVQAATLFARSTGAATAALRAQPAGAATAALRAQPVGTGASAVAVAAAAAGLRAKPEGRLPSPSPSFVAGKGAATAPSPAVDSPVGSPVSPPSPASPATAPVPSAPVRAVRSPASFVSPAAKGQASPQDRFRSVLAPAAPALSSTGSIGPLFAADKGGEKSKATTNDSLRATAEAKANATTASASRPGRPTPPSADKSDAQESEQDQTSPSEDESASASASASASGALAGAFPDRAPQINPVAAAFAASMTEANPPSASPGTSTRSTTAAVAKTGHLAGPLGAAESRFTSDAMGPASLPGFSTVAAAPHDKGAMRAAAASSDALASATDGAATPTTARAAASARAAQESDATTAKVAPHSSAVPPLPPPPEALAAAKPITVDAGTLGAHLSSQSLSLSPGAHLPALFEAAPVPTPAGTFWAQAAEDPSLHGALMNDTARVSLDAGAAGEITLHLRIKDGVADVRFEGTAAQALEIRPQELRIALASEGLTLGGFESGQSAPRDGQLESERRDSTPRPAAAPVSDPSRAIPVSANRAPASAVTLGGRLHVTA